MNRERARSKRRRPPAKPRGRIAGELLLDVHTGAALLGLTEKATRARIARQQLPHRRLGTGRVVFVRRELEEFVARLEGVGVDEALSNVGAGR